MAQDQAGIMSLPQQQGGQDPTLTLDDSYGVMSDALKNASPEASQLVDTTLDSIVPQLDQLSDEELDIFIQLVEKLYNEPDNYAENRANLISGGDLEEDDLPPEYDPDALSTMLLVLLRARDQRAKAGTAPETAPQEPMPEMPMAAMAPPGMLPPQQFARGGIVEAVRMVANSGRNGDTMLAHITPKEARLLRKHGGSGTINPATGLPEYGMFSFLKKAWNVVWKPVKKVLKSDIGRLVVNIAATVVLGPVLGPAVAAGLTTAAQGGEFKDILKSAVTAAAVGYLTGPTSPIAGPLNKLGATMGIESPLAQQAFRSGIVGAGAGLLQGQSLKDSVKTGLVSAGTAAAAQLATNAFSGTKAPPAPIGGKSAALGEVGMPLPDTGVSPALTGAPSTGAAVGQGQYSPFTQQGPISGTPGAAGISSVAAPVVANAGVSTPAPAVSAGTSTGAPVVKDTGSSTAYKVPGISESFSTMGQGAKQMFGSEPGSFMKGLETMGKGAGDLFMPSSPTVEQVTNSSAYQTALAKNMSPTAAFDVASKELTPGFARTYGPGAAAGLGVMALSGGFTPTPPESEMQKELYGTPGLDLVRADPSKYLVQNLPGVQYDAQGNIIGQGGVFNQPTMANVRVPSTYTAAPRYFEQGGIAALAQGGYPRRTGQISGPGTEKSDSIPAMLSDGEFVMTAKAVRGLGKGSRLEGAKRMYALMHQLESNASRG